MMDLVCMAKEIGPSPAIGSMDTFLSKLSTRDSKEQVSLGKEWNCHFLNNNNSTNELS